ncbi:MAG TPA: glucoamylase family protein [Albitalea sp.]
MSLPTPPRLTRRRLLALAGASALGGLSACLARAPAPAPSPYGPSGAELALLDDLEQRAFRFFWETTDPDTGLAPDRWPTPSFSSVAAIGFALSAYPIGIERGWITREQGRARVRKTLRFLHDAPQGPQAAGVAGHRGFFYHFLDMTSGTRFERCELSTVDTALLLAGALHCASWFDTREAHEAEIRWLAEAIYRRVDWRWAQARGAAISHGWHPESGFIAWDWKGYNEAMLVYLLALGSPTHAVGPEAWDAWTSTYDQHSWGTAYGQTHLRFPPLFGHQFTHCWVDFRGLHDAYMRRRGFDYFENSRRATYAQQAYAIANPQGWAGYGHDVWGITACDGPADVQREFGGRLRRFASYAGRGMGTNTYDDGTIAPYGAGSSIVFAPEIVVPALAAMRERLGAHIHGRYGFFAFNQSFTFGDAKLAHGRIVPGFGWVDTDYLGIEQGPLLAMLANQRSESVWRAMRGNAHLRRGLQRAGFSGGWLG